jgi:hypothetical protein
MHFPDSSFDAALSEIVAVQDIMYGLGPSNYHIEVPAEQDYGSLFGSEDAEHCFYALKSLAEEEVRDMRLDRTARNTFAMLASMVLQQFKYTFDVARWLATAHALIVGVDEYQKANGYRPPHMAEFVTAYMINE